MARKSFSLSHAIVHLLLKFHPKWFPETSSEDTSSVQKPLAPDGDAWQSYWGTQGQPWRTEPEISVKRQKFLSKRRSISPDIKQGIYPFKDIKLSRADVEWLLATHENGSGPVDWSDEKQRKREGLDLRGSDLRGVDLSRLPLARTRGGVTHQERLVTTRPERRLAAAHFEQANLFHAHLEGSLFRSTHLEGANLESAHLEGADCAGTHFEDTYLRRASLDGVYLRRAFFDGSSFLNEVSLGNEKTGFASVVDVRWNGVNLVTIDWAQITMLGDEQRARQKRTDAGEQKDKATRLFEYEIAVRANRQIATILQEQGLSEEAARFTYHAQILQRSVFRFQMLQKRATLRQQAKALGAWLFSWFLFLLAGYGYKLWHSFLAYFLVVSGFVAAYCLLDPRLMWNEAFAISMAAFHGRGFSPSTFSPGDVLSLASAFEAFIGLIIEVTLIATLSQRFFKK